MAALRYFIYLLIILASLLSACLGILGYFIPHISPHASAIAPFTGLLLPILLGFNVLLLIYWIIKRKWWILLPIITIAANYNYIQSIYRFTQPEQQVDPQTSFRAASYNIRHFLAPDGRITFMDLTGFIHQEALDLICLQEYLDNPKTTPDSLASLFDMPYYSYFHTLQKNYANFGIAIFSKFPIVKSGKIDLNSQTNDAMWADIKIGDNTVRVFNLHLQTTNFWEKRAKFQEEQNKGDAEKQKQALINIWKELQDNFMIRANQAKAIRSVIDTTHIPVIVCGDFNDTPVSYTFSTLQGNTLKDSFREQGKGYGYTFRELGKLLRIDYILYSDGLEVQSYDSPSLDLSDHNPVITDIKIKSGS